MTVILANGLKHSQSRATLPGNGREIIVITDFIESQTREWIISKG